MKQIIRFIYLILALGFATILQADPVIKATFTQNNICGDDVLALAVVLEYASTDGENFNIGSSSIFLNYDTDKLTFYEYTEDTNFDEHCYDVSETASQQNGFINISMDDVAVNSEFNSSTNSYLVGYVFFNIAVGESINTGDVYFNEYFTSFNNKITNDGSDQLTVEFDNELTINNETITCPSNDCDGNDPILVSNVTRTGIPVCTVDDGSLSLIWPNDPYYNDLYISIDGGQTFASTNAGQTSFSVNGLPVGDYDIKVKIGANGCVTTLDDINIKDFSHEVSINYQQPACGASDGVIELTWISKSVLDIQISIDGGINYTTVPGSDEYFKFENLAEGDYDIQVKWSYWKFACPANIEIVLLTENCCTGNDPVLINNITRSWVHVCTVDDGTLTLNWPNEPYYNDILISTDGGQTYAIPNAGQSSFTATGLAIGDYDIKVKIGENGCITTLEDINIVDFSHEVTRNWGQPTCGQSDGWIELTWVSKSVLDIQISIDGGTNYTTVPGADEYYRFNDLPTGDYDIRVKWSYALFACPTQLDDVNLGVKQPTNSGLRANYYCTNNRLRLREITLPAQQFRFQYRRLTNGSWTGWLNSPYDTDGIVNINNLPSNTTAVKYRVRVRCDGKWSGWGQQKHYNFPSCKLSSDQSDSILLYPNPANDYVSIAFSDIEINQSVIKIYNLTGKLIKEKSIAFNESVVDIDTSQLSNGMYLVRIVANGVDEIYSNKLTIAH